VVAYCPICLAAFGGHKDRCPEHSEFPVCPVYPGTSMSGKVFDGRFVLMEQIGSGATGTVFRALDKYMSGEEVALKVMLAHLASNPVLVKRFHFEIQAARKLKGLNFVRIRDFGRSKTGHLHFSMELLQGLPLSRVIEVAAPMAPAYVVEIGTQVCKALEEAHSKGIVHRDLKPDNIMLVRDRAGGPPIAKVLDFGIVKFVDEDAGPGPTAPNIMCGSAEYMSPEQAQALKVDTRSDIYSLGAVLHEMLSGYPPFKSDHEESNNISILLDKVKEDPKTLFEAFPKIPIPAALDRIVHHMLQRLPDDRPPRASLVRNALADVPT